MVGVALPRTFHALKSVPLTVVADGNELELDARVWCECSYRALRAKQSMRVVSGIRASADLRPDSSDWIVERLWVIHNHTCSVFKPPEQPKPETREGPCWEPGSNVDVVALVSNKRSRQKHFIRTEELSITVQITFEKLDVLTVTLKLLFYFLVTVCWTSFKSIRRR